MTGNEPVLVTGATGTQGAAVVDALLAREIPVRALVRTASPAALALEARGAALAFGDFEDQESLRSAMAGVAGVFSMQNPPVPGAVDADVEVRTGSKLVDAAKSAGVQHFVHTSVARAGDHESFLGWAENRWWRPYWTSKAAVNDLVVEADFPHWVILKPAFMMDNYIPPKATWMFPSLAERGTLDTALDPHVRLDLIAASDVGRFAAAAFEDPARFDGQQIALAAEALTMAEVAHGIGAATGRVVAAHSMSAEDAVVAGNSPALTDSQLWANIEGYRVDIARSKSFGIKLESFEDWALRHRAEFTLGG